MPKFRKGETHKGKKSDCENGNRPKLACLLPRCDGSHKIRNCLLATQEEVKQCLEKYWEENKERKNKEKALRSMSLPFDGSISTLFGTSFLFGAVE